MWFLYAPLVGLLVVGGVSAGLGFFPVTIVALVLAAGLGVAIITGRAKSMRLDSVSAPSGIPGTREASYDPRTDPGRTPPSSSTGTP